MKSLDNTDLLYASILLALMVCTAVLYAGLALIVV
jgi:hypothetical protein